jgi:glycosyltransferase involved in cell wall biosynthesis
MSLDDLTETSKPFTRGSTCVVVAAQASNERLRVCLESVRRHVPANTAIVRVDPSTEAVSRALEQLAPADIVLLSEPCRVSAGWLARLRDAARADTNTASASALADTGTALALSGPDEPRRDLSQLVDSVAKHTLRLRPRLNMIVGPCVYLRREALELIAPLDAALELSWSFEVDFAQRCLLAGLAHVAADDVVVEPLAPGRGTLDEPPALIRDRYPHLYEPDADIESGDDPRAPAWVSVAASGALPRAIEAARRPRLRLSVTIDGRALGSTLTGTQRHILELIRSLAATDMLDLRVLVAPDTGATVIDHLRSLPDTSVLATDEIDRDTPRSTIFHRPQQVFETADLRLALRLGERLVLNQLDLIAYRNPGYHADAAAWRRHRRVGRQALAAADRVIVSSNHTRLELLSDELTTQERVCVVPPGLDHASPANSQAPIIATGSSDADDPLPADLMPFMLCLGTDFRHKNRVFALRLLAELREHHQWRGRLVFAGTHIPYGSSQVLEQEMIERSPGLRDAVTDMGSIDEQEKAWLMERAAAIVYPSVYEGFGLVPLEAALSGVPCLFAPQSSLAEVLPPDAAAIVPWDAKESAARAHELLKDPATRKRQVSVLAEVAKGLTWKDSARTTVEVYREAVIAPVRESVVLSRDEVRREHELRELIAAHDALVARLVGERAHAQRAYNELNAEVGFALSLIGPHGTLPEDVQRALLALSARPALSRSLYGTTAGVFRTVRALRIGRSARDSPDRG